MVGCTSIDLSSAARFRWCRTTALLVALVLQAVSHGSEFSSRDIDRLVQEERARRRACGPVCVWHVLNTIGIETDLSAVLDESSIEAEGIPLSKVARLLRARGLQPKIIRVASRDPDILPTPAIIVVQGTHCAVFHGWDRANMAVCFEPVSPEIRRIPVAKLQTEWSGEAVVLSRPGPSMAATIAAECAAAASLLLLVAYVLRRRRLWRHVA